MYPKGGDAVRLIAPWSWGMIDVGKIGVIEGRTDKEYKDNVEITFNYSCFRGKSSACSDGPEYVSCSGGPGTIATPVSELKPTNETTKIRVWRWKDVPRGGGGVDYEIEVPVWEWTPKND